MSTPINPSHCPLCNGPNQCGIESGKRTCWCFETPVSASVLERVPPEARGIACVCPGCAKGRRSLHEVQEQLQAVLRRR